MNMVIPDAGKVQLLYWALVTDGLDLEDFTLDLFKNDYTPDNDSVLANFTKSNFLGYSTVDVTRADFDFPVIVAHVAYAVLSFIPTWECTGGAAQNAYGWYLTGADSLVVIAAQRFDTPHVMANGVTERLNPFPIGSQTLH